MARTTPFPAARSVVAALLIILSISTRRWAVVDAATTETPADDAGKVKVSTKINLRLHSTYSKMEVLDHESTFKQLIEQCFDNELPRIEALSASSSSSTLKLSHVRVRVLGQLWGDEYQIESSSSSNARMLQEMKLQPLTVRLIVTGRYNERGPKFEQDGPPRLPSSADFYSTIKSFFDGGGGDIMVDEYIPSIQEVQPGNFAMFFTEVEEIELLEPNGVVIEEDALFKKNEVDSKVEKPGLIAGCVLLGIAFVCIVAMIVIRKRKRHRFTNGDFSQPDPIYLPSEIDLESVGGSIVSGMYYSSTGAEMLAKPNKGNIKGSNNLLPQRSSEEDTDRDESLTIGDEVSEAESSNGIHNSSFLQQQTDGNTKTNEANLGESSMACKDFSNIDIEAQAKARLMGYLARYSDETSQNREEDKSTTDGASRASHDGSAASFVSQEASLLKNLGVAGALGGEVGDEEKAKHEVTSFCASIDAESNNGVGSNASGTSKSDNIDLDLRSTESNLLRNLGVATLPIPDVDKSAQSSPSPIDNDVGGTGGGESAEGKSDKEDKGAEEIGECEDEATLIADGSIIEPRLKAEPDEERSDNGESKLCEKDNGGEGEVDDDDDDKQSSDDEMHDLVGEEDKE